MKEEAMLLALTDKELVSRICVEKNTILFGYLYDRYEAKVYNKCYSFVKSKTVAVNLTQDIFVKVFTKLHTFKGKLSFSTWLYALTYNLCANYNNRDKETKISRSSENIEDHAKHLQIEVSDNSLFQMKTDKLQKALEFIDPNDKSILLLKYQDDVSIKELESILNISESEVKMRLKRAKARIIEMYNTI